MKQPQDCNNLGELRTEIDRLDREVIKILGQRFGFVKRVPEYKEDNKESVVAQARYDEVMQHRRDWAMEEGLNPDVIESVYTTLVKYFIDEQMKIKNL